MTKDPIRSEIVDTGNPRIKSAQIIINAPCSTIFAILANPRKHQEIDGTKTITQNTSGPDELVLGSTFGMKMHLVIDYRITNTVVEYEKNTLIAWRHLGRWRWRYQLSAITENQTLVTEVFDGTLAPLISQLWLRARKAYPWTQMAVAKSLVRLKEVAEHSK